MSDSGVAVEALSVWLWWTDSAGARHRVAYTPDQGARLDRQRRERESGLRHEYALTPVELSYYRFGAFLRQRNHEEEWDASPIRDRATSASGTDG